MISYHVCRRCNVPARSDFATARGADFATTGWLAIVCYDCAHERLLGRPVDDHNRGARAIDVALLHRVEREAHRLAKAAARSHDRASSRRRAA